MSVQTTFQNAVNYFNNEDWDSLELLMHNDVKMWKVDDNQAPIIGKVRVMEYLRSQTRYDGSRFYPQSATSVEEGGVVHGTALWQDNAVSRPKVELINYVFKFQADQMGNWAMLHLKGSLA